MVYAMKEVGLKGHIFELTIAMAILLQKLLDGEFETIEEDDLQPAVLTDTNVAIKSSN